MVLVRRGGVLMNEALAVYLNLDMENIEKNEEIIRKIDELLLTVGMKYSGIMNLYISVDDSKNAMRLFFVQRNY